jgi:hypothetical protein
MLTEIVGQDTDADVPALNDRADDGLDAPADMATQMSPQLAAELATQFSPQLAAELATQVRDAVTLRLLQRSHELVDRHLHEHLGAMVAAEVQQVTDGLAARLRTGLEPVLRELIAQAVSEELDRYNRGLSSPPPGP